MTDAHGAVELAEGLHLVAEQQHATVRERHEAGGEHEHEADEVARAALQRLRHLRQDLVEVDELEQLKAGK